MPLYLIVYDNEPACVTTEEPSEFIPQRWPAATYDDCYELNNGYDSVIEWI